MATVQHAALDGSEVTIGGDADMSMPLTAFGLVRPRGWRRSHAFNVFPAGKSEQVLATVPQVFPEVEYTLLEDTPHNGGTLRMALVRWPLDDHRKEFVYAVWEGSTSSLTTSIQRGTQADMEDLFDRLAFHETPLGLAMDSPVDESVRPLRCLKQVGTTLLEISPRSREVARTLPRGRGKQVEGGELFRRSSLNRDVLLVTPTAAVYASPLDDSDAHVDLAAAMTVSWAA